MITAEEAKDYAELALFPCPISVILESMDYKIREAAKEGTTHVYITSRNNEYIGNFMLEQNKHLLSDLITELEVLGYKVTIESVPISASRWLKVDWS